MRRTLLSWLSLGALASCAASPPTPPPTAPSPTASQTPAAPEPTPAPLPSPPPASSAQVLPGSQGWEAIDSGIDRTIFEAHLAQWGGPSRCESYDYFPDGGPQSFWCHRPESLSFESIQKMAGVPVFASGPHKTRGLIPNQANDFGHYNPAFVRWLLDRVSPSGRDSPARKATQAHYEANVRPLAEVFVKVLSKLKADEDCFKREKALYEGGMRRKSLPMGYGERWFFFMNPFFCPRSASGQLKGASDPFFYDNGFDGGVSGNVTKGAVGFWMRRSIDGTFDSFAEGLMKLIRAYQPSLLVAQGPRLDPDALLKNVDEAVAAMSKACRVENGGMFPLRLIVSNSGRVRTLATTSSKCLDDQIAALRLPPFDGDDLPFNRYANLNSFTQTQDQSSPFGRRLPPAPGRSRRRHSGVSC